MNKLYRSQNFQYNSKKDFYKCLYGKSKYLKDLERKKIESYNLLSNQKFEIINNFFISIILHKF